MSVTCCTCAGKGQNPEEVDPAPTRPGRKLPKDMEPEEYKASSLPCAECKQNVDASHWCDICNGNMHGHCGIQMYENEEATRGPRRCKSCQAFSGNEREFHVHKRKQKKKMSSAGISKFVLL